ncbi:hypothetical protein CDL12_04984 [Handroanthus impetiginosus]|uniref:F-box domain-containing protein n=1 Tax=Handroanthus impetiginosus TaxID=429701 RepID=A0A2G9HXR1_9LAMI|nr:hypothetical protein CDL12_04984 [Handroanthus impetiginosus]
MEIEIESCGDICELSEDCIANVLSLTSPKDACRLSAVSSIFRSASQSDTVWDRFLPSDYREIISSAVGEADPLLGQFHSRKDLFLHLCDHPILIDDGRKSFSLEKMSGKKCYMLAARELSIVWGDTPEYWQWIHLPQSRFSEVAELLDVCWLEISGKINTHVLSSRTNYAAYLVFTWNTETFGFSLHPANGSVSIGGHESERRSFYLVSEEEQLEENEIAEEEPQQLEENEIAEEQLQQPEENEIAEELLQQLELEENEIAEEELRQLQENEIAEEQLQQLEENEILEEELQQFQENEIAEELLQQLEENEIAEEQLQDNAEQRQQQDNAERGIQYPKRRDDGWMEVELGECFATGGQDGDLEVSLTMLTGNWKSGIIVQGIEIRPKECK